LLAAMADHALDHHVARLADDHRRAGELAAALRTLPGLSVDGPHTSMVFVTLPGERLEEFFAHLAQRRIRVFTRGPSLRLVTHLDVDDAGVERAIDAFRAFYR
jgi:threonine aldolase